MPTTKLYLGLDVHNDSVTIAVAEGDPKGEIRLLGTGANDLRALEQVLNGPWKLRYEVQCKGPATNITIES